MYLEDLPTETITQIFLNLPTVSSAVSLSSTCHRFHQIYASSKKLLILSQAAESEFGPVQDIIQLVTHNASQPAHVQRSAPLSETLIRSIVRVGRVAVKWENLYPFKKWKADYENRRIICVAERFILRRALYRLWLFTRAFHNGDNPRLLRATPMLMRERAALLHNFSTPELAEMMDVHNVIRDVVSNNVCPSNGAVRRKFHKRFPDSNYQLLFNIHLNYPPPTPSSFVSDGYFHSSQFAKSKFHSKFTPTRTHEPGAEGWGDDILHYYVVEDMLKLDPEQIIWLKENAPFKGQVETYVKGLGDWFDNNGETFMQTLEFVVQQRGEDMTDFKASVEDGELGVALVDDE
ncbi:hypothetical protein MBLNU459_g5302t1 [Dothideomycetes sp. NU459]